MSTQRATKTLASLMPGSFDAAHADIAVTGISSDSRIVEEGNLFFALEGYSRNGSEFAADAVLSGAVAVASNDAAICDLGLNVPVCLDQSLSQKTSLIAGRFYGHPSEAMDVVGITGTNGKTSCCFWLTWMLAESGLSTGHIGTLGAGMGANANSLHATGFTTPDALQVQKLLSDCQQAGADAVVMEVSSHGLDQGRVAAVHYESAIFTNISQDHLDYHKDMDAYLATKLKLFERPELKRVVANLDDASCDQIKAAMSEGVEFYSYSLNNPQADIFFSEIRPTPSGYEVTLSSVWGNSRLTIPVFGEYNLSNLLAVSATALAKGVDFSLVVDLLGRVPGVPGRMQCLSVPGAPDVVVDYAHTPDAVASVLGALRSQVSGQLIVVVGCGGERDAEKRPLMAQAAFRYADKQVFTSDNPRNEDPVRILDDMLAGLSDLDKSAVNHIRVIEDRRAAIESALEMARENDLVAVLGKGHENQQIIAGKNIEFNDAAVCQSILARIAAERAAT